MESKWDETRKPAAANQANLHTYTDTRTYGNHCIRFQHHRHRQRHCWYTKPAEDPINLVHSVHQARLFPLINYECNSILFVCMAGAVFSIIVFIRWVHHSAAVHSISLALINLDNLTNSIHILIAFCSLEFITFQTVFFFCLLFFPSMNSIDSF